MQYRFVYFMVLFVFYCINFTIIQAQSKHKKDKSQKDSLYYPCYCQFVHEVPFSEAPNCLGITFSIRDGSQEWQYYDKKSEQVIWIRDEERPPIEDTLKFYKHIKHLYVNFPVYYYFIGIVYEGTDTTYHSYDPPMLLTYDSLMTIKAWKEIKDLLRIIDNLETLTLNFSITQYEDATEQAFVLPKELTRHKIKKLSFTNKEEEDYHLKNKKYDGATRGLPRGITELKHLKELHLIGVDTLSEDLTQLKHLEHLKIEQAYGVKEFPKQVYDIRSLKSLVLYTIKDTLPEGISRLKNLEYLSVGNPPVSIMSPLSYVPAEELCSMKKLKKFSLYSSLIRNNETIAAPLKECLKGYYFANDDSSGGVEKSPNGN
ncbi:MAG: hypothetical protein IPL35_06900 [Sphingobacteriales bacterium]|nr:hypothetical protein [Sphingobacteriales bacterium]